MNFEIPSNLEIPLSQGTSGSHEGSLMGKSFYILNFSNADNDI